MARWEIVTPWRGKYEGIPGKIFQIGLPRVTLHFGGKDDVISLESLDLDETEYEEFIEEYTVLLEKYFNSTVIDKAYARWERLMDVEIREQKAAARQRWIARTREKQKSHG